MVEKMEESKVFNIRKSLFMKFRICEQQGVYSQADGNEGYSELNLENEHLLKGQIFHHAMEDLYNEMTVEELNTLDDADVLGYINGLLPKTTQVDLIKWFAWYGKYESERYLNMKKDGKLEYFMPYKQEYYVEKLIKGINRTGHFDRVDRVSEKELVIVEYKTGNSYDPNKSWKLTNLNAELEWYRSIIDELDEFKDFDVVGWRLLNPTLGIDFYKKFNVVTKYSVNKASENILKLLNKEKVPVKKIGFPCQWCPYIEECQQFENNDHKIFGKLSDNIMKQENKEEMQK